MGRMKWSKSSGIPNLRINNRQDVTHCRKSGRHCGKPSTVAASGTKAEGRAA
jgi:hypothetical protein